MRSKGFLLLLILCLAGTQVFAQNLVSASWLPEPGLPEIFTGTAEQYPESPISGFGGVAEILWDLGGGFLPEPMVFFPVASLAAAADTDAGPDIPRNIRNNQYYIESVRLNRMAKQTYDEGDYDASANYAAEALRYAQLSDEYVALQLKIKEANDAISAAKARIDWVVSVGAAKNYPGEYAQAQDYYNASLEDRKAEKWESAAEKARRVINTLANVKAPAQTVTEQPKPSRTPLPARYTVRPWAVSKDCLWNIAGRPWAYGDPTKWRLIYNANRARMPQPDNPDLIEPGMVLDIPSIRGETREGMWDSAGSYEPLR
ncbi:MAG: LysM peptidoglycan-binding domain-containing protein [Treponema sp.]|jgi:Skp family chaperone for outer membrane proteins|nr:LysM peptidoglycan-binding domain-containing protein [Treponema sp.]